MKRVKDENGIIVPGVFKNDLGTVIIDDSAEFNKYKRHKELASDQSRKIHDLTGKVEDLERMVRQLLATR